MPRSESNTSGLSRILSRGTSQATTLGNPWWGTVMFGHTVPMAGRVLMQRVSLWLGEVKRDLETPDLWAELQREAKLLGAGSNAVTENTPFTPGEQKEIAGRLKELAKYVRKTHSLSPAQMQALDEKLEYLVDASHRLGRKDWLNAFIGVTLGYMLSVALPPESARTIFLTFLRAIGLLYPELLIE